MKPRHFYAIFNHYGSDTSSGFSNTWDALTFDSKTERNDYVKRWERRNKTLRACTCHEAAKYLERDVYSGEFIPRPLPYPHIGQV